MDKVPVELEVSASLEPLSAAQIEHELEAAMAHMLRCGVPENVWRHKTHERMNRLSVVQMRRKGDVV